MAFEIVWTPKAIESYDAIIEYLENSWYETVIEAFILNTKEFINKISIYPEIGELENIEKQIRGIVISRHHTIFYTIENQQVILLNFFDNRSNPQNKF